MPMPNTSEQNPTRLFSNIEKPISDWSIDTKLHKECVAILKPYSYSKLRESIFVLDTILTALDMGGALDHSISVGLIYGSLCQEFYQNIYPRINFFSGFIPGLIHDVGKYEQKNLFNSKKKFDSEEREQVKNHVPDTLNILSDYPMLKRLVGGHHSYGQPDGISYPENFREKNIHMKSLQRTLAIADKASASIELRPELALEEKAERQTVDGLIKQVNRLYTWFGPEKSTLVPKQIDYIKRIITQKMVISPHDPRKKISVDDDFKEILIKNGYLTPDLSRLEFSILRLPLQGVDKIRMVKLLTELTKERSNFSCKVSFETATSHVKV
ncbi:MAG: hypothetical protein AAB603_00275 [Patescibacteria group bacterium]